MSVVHLQKLETSVDKYTVNISWSAVDQAVAYELEINGKIYESRNNTYTLKNASVGDDQTIRVRACFTHGFGEWSGLHTFTVKDITAPKAGKLVLKQTDAQTINLAISGDSDNDKVAVYKFYLNGKELYSGAEKSFDYVNGEMGGKLNFTALVVDAAGNVSQEVKSSITVQDMTPPEQVKNVKVDEAAATEKSALITWDAPYDNVGVTNYIVTVDGKEYKSTKTSITVKNLGVGTHTVTVQAFDKAKTGGAVSDKIEFFAKDITAPKAGKLVLKQTDAQTINLAISGDSDNDKVAVYKFYLNGKELYSGAEKSFDYVNGEMGGKLNFTALVVDAAGNKSKEVKSSITVKDMTPPDAVTNIAHNKEASEKSVTLTWTAPSDNVGVTGYIIKLNGKEYKTSKNSITIKNPGLGHRTVNIVALDKAKNASNAVAYTFWAKDATAPKAGKITDVIQYHSQDTFLLAFNGFSDAEEGIAGYNVYVNNTDEVFAYISGSESAYVYENYHAAGSKITFAVEAVDFEGNKSKKVKKVYTVKDMIAPEKITGLYVKDHTAKKTVLDWDDAKDNVKTTKYAITVKDAEGNVVTETSSSKSEVNLKGIADGKYSVTIIANDKAGNKSVSNNEIVIGTPAVYAMLKSGNVGESADDTWENAVELNGSDGILSQDIWLCGEEFAANSNDVFADSVDYLKFNKTSAQQSISVDIDVTSSDALSIELLDASGNTIDTIANWSEYSLEELKNGTYGIKVQVAANSKASGIISVE